MHPVGLLWKAAIQARTGLGPHAASRPNGSEAQIANFAKFGRRPKPDLCASCVERRLLAQSGHDPWHIGLETGSLQTSNLRML